jgi:dolichol-phosphate mannosyltransferase
MEGELTGMASDTNVSIIIPTYKENDNIRPLVERLHKSMGSYKYEILFVDDNSRDGTEDTVNSLAGKYPVKVMVRKDKRGLSSAVVDGIKATDGEFVIVMDADLQHPPEVVPNVVKALETHDLAVWAHGTQRAAAPAPIGAYPEKSSP